MNYRINRFLKKIDELPLSFLGAGIIVLIFAFYAWLGERCVFEVHDQLDETICSYVFMARHLFEGTDIYPEMMNGISPSGIFPSAILFVPLYRVLPTFWAFLLQYFIITLTAFGGMYGLLKKVTKSSGIALIVGMIFSMLPFMPVYGLSVMGVPMLALCYLQLYRRRHRVLSFLGILYFALSTHLVLIGYVVLTYLAIYACFILWKKKGNFQQDIWFYAGVAVLLLAYCLVNYEMFTQLFWGSSGFVSHREEFINHPEGIQVWQNIRNVFVYGEQSYAPSYHRAMILVCAVITLLQGGRYKKLSESGKGLWKLAVSGWVVVLINALLYGFLSSVLVMNWRNEQTGFFRYFQANRYYMAYPTLWWILIGICLALVWKELPQIWEWVKLAVLVVLLVPTLLMLKPDLVLYDNVNGYHHGSAYTGKLTWQEYYMQDVLKQVDAYIGKDKASYRIGHVGLSPAPSLVYGFYTIDGYSNNYSLEYKHAFRKIIEKELDKSQTLQTYFDTWGSRCYLFSAEGDNALKGTGFVYENLEYNVEQLKQLGCEYIFSASEIAGKTKGLIYEGTFDTPESVYEIWLYRIE